jgi:hypothetical protein
LRGEKISDESDIDSCFPVTYNKDLKITTQSVSGDILDPEAVAHPCGISARSVFNDTFSMTNSNDVPIDISPKGIAWADDITYRYLNCFFNVFFKKLKN